MTDHQLTPTLVPCPSCDAEIDAHRALNEGGCPECHTLPRGLSDAAAGQQSGDTVPDDEPQSYKLDV